MKVLIIEDEKLAAARLQRLLLELIPDAEVLAVCEGVLDAAAWLKQNAPPDCITLDIQLSDGTAFDLLQRVNITTPIIFTTAFENFALQAHKVNSVDYLLKPVKKEDLYAALLKLDSLRQYFLQHHNAHTALYQSRFMIRLGTQIISITTEEIAYFYAEHKCTMLKSKVGKSLPIDQNLDSLEKVLDPKLFFRINRQLLIHYTAIEHMKTHTKGRVLMTLLPSINYEAVVSSERAAAFKQWLNDRP